MASATLRIKIQWMDISVFSRQIDPHARLFFILHPHHRPVRTSQSLGMLPRWHFRGPQTMTPPLRLAYAVAFCAAAACSASAASFPKLPEGYLHSAPAAHAKNGKLEASIEASIPLECAKAWAVFTDYENMPKFLPGLERSLVKSKANGKILLEQSGVASYGIFSKRYQSTRQLTIVEGESIDSESIDTDEVPFSSSATFARKPLNHCVLRYTTIVDIPKWTPAFAAIGFAKSTAILQMQSMLSEMNRRYPGAPQPANTDPSLAPSIEPAPSGPALSDPKPTTLSDPASTP